ncbi:MAG TPA: hypothetical protein VI385_15200 [Flavisolibacter sp.]
MKTPAVEVFKTDVEDEVNAREIIQTLVSRFPGSRVNFDLQDCDRVLRVEGIDLCSESIIVLMKESGFSCTILE